MIIVSGEALDFKPRFRMLYRRLGEIDACGNRASANPLGKVCSRSYADLENGFATGFVEACESRYLRVQSVTRFFNFPQSRAQLCACAVTDSAGLLLPKLSYRCEQRFCTGLAIVSLQK